VRQLRPRSERLYVDWLAVATGLRPAAMLEYAPAHCAAALCHQCERIRHQARVPTLRVLVWATCPWLINVGRAIQRLRSLRLCDEATGSSSSPGMWIVRCSEPPGAQACQVIPAHQIEVCSSIALHPRGAWMAPVHVRVGQLCMFSVILLTCLHRPLRRCWPRHLHLPGRLKVNPCPCRGTASVPAPRARCGAGRHAHRSSARGLAGAARAAAAQPVAKGADMQTAQLRRL
jgi:hypothetical protein